MNSFFEYLGSYDIVLEEEDRSNISSKLKSRKYLKGQYISQSGDVSKWYSFIISGKVRTFYLDTDGDEHIIAFGIENWWVADLGSLITQKPADFEVQCLENTEVIQIHHEDLQELYKTVPKLERFFRLLIQNAYVFTQKRLVRNLSLSAQERYLLLQEEHPQFIQRFPQYMIASYLGVTKEFLSHLKSQIAKSRKS